MHREVETLCDTWLAAKHEALSSLDEIAGAMEAGSTDLPDLARRCRRIHAILGDVLELTDRVVRQLQEAARENARLGLAALLVTECAANILISIPAALRANG